MAYESSIRDEEIQGFLAEAGWGDAERAPLDQDASTRRYERLIRPNGERAMLMDAPGVGEDPPCPPGADEAERIRLGWNASSRLAASRVEAFAAISHYLKTRGYSPPEVFTHDSERGLAIVEDLGDRLFARLLETGEADEIELYAAAGAFLADLHNRPSPAQVTAGGDKWPILDHDALAIRINARLFPEWMPRLVPEMRCPEPLVARYETEAEALIHTAMAHPKAFMLRDFHAENLLWLPEREGHGRIGLLDFQDATNGARTWDHSMLLHDARRDVSAKARAAATRAYLDASGMSEEVFERELAVAGALNTLRILGLFARLIIRDGKPRYGDFMAREWGHLVDTLSHPATAEIARVVDQMLPDWRSRAA